MHSAPQDCSGRRLLGATLFGATLLGAILFGATLFGAMLFGAILFGTILFGTILFCAMLFGMQQHRRSVHGCDASSCAHRRVRLCGRQRWDALHVDRRVGSARDSQWTAESEGRCEEGGVGT
ncbi:hypothetical protein GIS00_26650 [Nakamurella sp. YIM 132087]|uniref:Uncharacterized protein n=1 Tax=Nakamurella alba TaxID=2665158 RepID=A0A7K1FWB7_9ACTN|nr:pentapeptide repeat-containing protein [Nakamurella alba]MTD17513.1 hypothetical protein [Nakamurella alba]